MMTKHMRVLLLFLMILSIFFVSVIEVDAANSYYKYEIPILTLTSNPTDAQTIYFGGVTRAPTTTAAISKIIIPESGTITAVYLYTYSGTAGTAEAWAAYLRINNAVDYIISTKSISANERVFQITNLSIAVTEITDYVEIKMINPTWATNPVTTLIGGYIEINATTIIPNPTFVVNISLPTFNFTANNTFLPNNYNNITANVSLTLTGNMTGGVTVGGGNMTGTENLDIFGFLTIIPIIWTILAFVFSRWETKGLSFIAAIISWVSWVSIGIVALTMDLSYSIGIVFLYALCGVPSFILMIYLIPESWFKKQKS